MNIGLLGGGQLGLMMIEAAKKLNHKVIVLDSDKNCPAKKKCNEFINADFADKVALSKLADKCETFTIENENVPTASLRLLSKFGPVRPNAECVELCQNRIKEKNFVSKIGIPVVPFLKILNKTDCEKISRDFFPAILKTAEFGYDGKGQEIVKNIDEAKKSFKNFNSVPCILEKKLDLTKELSIIMLRNFNGEIKNYPVAENLHKNGILYTSIMPANIPIIIQNRMYSMAREILMKMNFCGVLCVEFFLSEQGLFVNELAPRPHNSGHQTIEACTTSQFEQQVRISTSMSLGSVKLSYPAKIINILGDMWFDENQANSPVEPDWGIYKKKGLSIYLYGKKEPRRGRKMGHFTESFKD